MLKSDAAAFLAGVTQVEGAAASAPTNLHVITGEVGTTSEEGKTIISIDGLVFSEEDSQEIEIDTLGGLEEGDVATVILTGESGHGMTPLAIGAPGSVDRLKARVVEAELLIADKADIEDLEAATARIGDLEADHVSVNTLEAATARIETLEVDHVSIADFEVEQANIDSLQVATADIDTIRANSAKVQNLTAAQLEADHATIGTLDTTYMHADMANADVAWIQNGTIKNGAIVSAMINDVSANKLTAGTINGSVVNVTNLNADNITAGTINGQRIGEGSLSLSKLEENVYTESEVDDIVDDLNDRIDGAIETHTGTAVPTLNNSPASSWNTTALKDEHVGDVYYVVNSQSQQNGYCYRFTKSGSTYSWQLIKDSDVTAALSRLTTAEGKITSIESFDSTVSSFMTNTDSELTSVKSRATSLETRMTDAEGDISEKVDTSTFNTLSQTVDGNSASITSMSTVLSNNGLTSSTNITNTVNTVSQTASGNSSKITQLTTTLGTNADGTTKTGDIVHRTSAVEQDLSEFKTTVSQTYATNTTVDGLATRVSTAESNITQNAENITLKAKKMETIDGNMLYDVDAPNLTKIFGPANRYFSDSGNASFMVCDIRAVTDSPATGIEYMAHWSVSGSSANKQRGLCFYSGGNYIQFVTGQKYILSCWVRCTSGKFTYCNNAYNTAFPTSSGARTIDSSVDSGWQFVTTTVTATRTQLDRVYFMARTLSDSLAFECDMCGFKMVPAAYATQAELKVANDEISSKVSKDGVISSINQSSESVSINANKINLTGAVTISDLASDAQNATLNSNISVGGRNLLTGSGDWSDISTSSTNPGTVSGDTFTFSAHESLAWYGVHISYPHMPFDDVDGKTLTLGFDYRSDDFSDTTGDHYIYINAAASATIDGDRSKYRQISTSTFDGVYVPTTEWQRGSITFDLSESLLTSGSGACNYFFIQFYNHTLNSLQLRHVKLEVGNVATDWTAAPEDVQNELDNLSGYIRTIVPFNNAFDDTSKWYTVPNASTWTKLNDGWARCSYTNAGSSASSTYVTPMAENIIDAYDGGEFTFLVELRNVSFGTATPSGNFAYMQQMAGAQFWGNTVNSADGFASTTYVTYANVSSGSYTHRFVKPVDANSGTGTYAGLMFRYRFYLPANTTTTFDVRISIYPARYLGSYTESLAVAAADSIVDASKTATSYVTEITGQNGIMVHPSTEQTTGVQITSDVDILRDGTSVINIGTQGDTSGNTDAGVTIYDGEGNESSNILARFTGNRIRLGKHIDDNEENDGAYVDFFDGDWFVNRLDSNVFVRDDPDDPARTLSLGMSTAIEGTFPGTKAFIDASFGASAQVYGDELGAHEQITRSSLSSGTSGRYSSTSMGVVTSETYEIVDGYQEKTDSSRQAYIRADELELTYDVGQMATTRTHSIEHVSVVLRSPIGTYTGTDNSATASASGWQLTYFNTVVAEVGSPRTYDYTFSNGVLTAKRDCVLEISGVMNWYDTIAGLRGFGIFEGTTAGSGTEHSAFQSFASNLSGNRKSAVFPSKIFSLSYGDSLTFSRYQQQNAVYVNGYNYSWVTIRVVG